MPNLNQAGIIDLSALKPAPQKAPGAAATGSFVTEVTDAGFDALVQQSLQFPIVLEFYSPRANAQEMSDTLARLANAAGGRWLLARVNVDTERQLAAQLQVTAVPMVAAVLAGQLVPLWQGTTDAAQAEQVLAQLMALAAQNGIVGQAPAQGPAPEGEGEAAKPADPRFAAADAALEAGDYATAVAEFDKLLQQSPGDPEVVAGRAQAALLQRTQNVDVQSVLTAADAAPDDAEKQFAAADVEVLMGSYAAGFDRLIRLVRESTGDERDAARKRLLELFETVGNGDPAVLKARRDLTSALF